MKQLVSGNENIIKQQDVEIQRLTVMLRRLDDEALIQRKEYDQVGCSHIIELVCPRMQDCHLRITDHRYLLICVPTRSLTKEIFWELN